MRIRLNYGFYQNILCIIGLLFVSTTFAKTPNEIGAFFQNDNNVPGVAMPAKNGYPKSDVASINYSTQDRFLSSYVVYLLEKNFDETYKKYYKSLDRLGLIDLIKMNDFNYNDYYKTTNELSLDFTKMFNRSLNAIGLIGMKISPKILFSLETMAEKQLKNGTKILVFLAVFLKTLAPEIALTVKENSRSQKWVDIANKWVCSHSVDELVFKIYSICEKLLDSAQKNEKDPKVLNKIFDIKERLFVKSGSFKNDNIVDKRLQNYENLLSKHKEYIDSLKNEGFLESEKKRYSMRSKGAAIDYDGAIAAKDSELQREFHQKSIDRAIKVLMRNSFISKNELKIVSQIFNMAINASIKIKDKVEFLSMVDGNRLIDSLCRENFKNSLSYVQLGDKFKPEVLKDFVNKHIVYNCLNSLVGLVTGDKSVPDIFTPEFSSAIRSEIRADVFERVYPKISLDMIIGLPAIFKSYFNNLSFKSQDHDRMLAFGGGLVLLVIDTAQAITEKMYNFNPELSELFNDKEHVTTFIFDSSKEIVQTLVENSTKSKYASFIKDVEKIVLNKRTDYYSRLSRGQKYQDASIESTIASIEKIKNIKKAFGGNMKNKIKNVFKPENEKFRTKLQTIIFEKASKKGKYQ